MTNLGKIKIAFKYRGVERHKTFITVKNETGEILLETHVKCAIHDQHDKRLGRFQAFRKAMTQLMLRDLATRQQRKVAWETYANMIKVPANINLVSKKREKRKIIAQ